MMLETIQSIYKHKPIKAWDQLTSLAEFLSAIEKEHPDLAFDLSTVPKKVLIRSLNTLVGIEIETEGLSPDRQASVPLAATTFVTVADGSLRNGGCEFVSRIGVRAFYLYQGLKKLFNYLQERKAVVSDRTSIHVHVNVMNMSMDELNSMMILYSIVEDSLFKYAGDFREHNIFCTPSSYMAKQMNLTLSDFLKSSQKYSAMNTLAVQEKGTVEFRHMHTSYDMVYVFRWVVILCLLRYYARYHSLEEIKNTVANLKTKSEYSIFFRDLFYGFAKYLPIDEGKVDSLATDAKLLFFGDY